METATLNSAPENESEVFSNTTGATPEVTKPRQCRSCGNVGHTARNCPQRAARTFTPATPGDPVTDAAAEEAASRQPKLHIPLKTDGSIDIEAMQVAKVEQLKTAVNLTQDALRPKTSLAHIENSSIDGFYTLLGKGEAFLAAKMVHCDPARAMKVFEFSESLKDQLREPSKRIAARLIPEQYFKYQDEMTVAYILIADFQSKITLLKGQVSESAVSPS